VNFASLPLIFMGGWTGYAIRQAAGVGLPLTFLKFTRSFEREADYLGLQYLHRTGYDPTAFVDFFERLETAEKKKPGAIAKAFSTHPLTDSRVRRAQKEIREILEAKPEYVVSTSEYERVKQRLRLLANRHEVPGEGRPHLRRRPAARIDSESSRKPQQEEERPKLKRRN
jgi:predicted Zn-dependent protease